VEQIQHTVTQVAHGRGLSAEIDVLNADFRRGEID
jgi:hypothetical protein